jgi:asparagine synthase (glutamine-hydrolysing)
MFAFAVWDERTRSLAMATDPFGEKPLLFSERDGSVLFASDVGALRAADPSVGRPNPKAVSQFLALDLMPAFPNTFFEDIQRLPAVHVARWEPGSQVSLRRYWAPRIINVPTHPGDAAEHLRGLLVDSVRLRMRSDVPVGTSLSGGVDSSGIAALMAAIAGNHSRHAFTATFDGFARDEWQYAEAAARAADIGTHHAVRPRSTELLEDLESFVQDQEEPVGSTSIYAQWRLMRAARAAGVIVMLDGQGADELFAGYPGTIGWVLRSLGPLAAGRAAASSRTLAHDLAIAYLSQRAPRQLVRRYRRRQTARYVTPDAARLASHDAGAPADWLTDGSALRRELGRQTFRTSLPHLCRFADRDSMAHSVEVRLPYLDTRIADFALSLPAGILYRENMTKAVLRDALRGLAPDAVLDRRDKVGYETPEATWFNEPAVRDRFAEILLDPSALAAGSVDVAVIERERKIGRWSDPRGLWRAVNVELWLRHGAHARAATASVPA